MQHNGRLTTPDLKLECVLNTLCVVRNPLMQAAVPYAVQLLGLLGLLLPPLAPLLPHALPSAMTDRQ